MGTDAFPHAAHIPHPQAASNLANIGVASMLLGSPPPGPSPMHSPPHMPGMPYGAPPPMALGSGALPPGMVPLDYGMHPAMAQHPGYEAAVYGMQVPGGGDMGLQMQMQMPVHGVGLGTPQAHRFAGARSGPGGFSPPGPRGYRGTPSGGRMSRFAPQDAVAAF